MPGAKSQAHQMDELARARGFPDYSTWKAWNAHRAANLKKPQDYTTSAAPAGQPTGQPQTVGNWFQMLRQDPAQAFARLMPQSSGIMRAADHM